MSENDWTDEPTNEYNMRHAANELVDFANKRHDLTAEDLAAIDFAYKQLLRGANVVRRVEPDAPLKIRDMVGVLQGDWTRDLNSVGYVRQQREGK